jgi:hypothetical protein
MVQLFAAFLTAAARLDRAGGDAAFKHMDAAKPFPVARATRRGAGSVRFGSGRARAFPLSILRAVKDSRRSDRLLRS